jgi:TPR repeat protein
MNKRRLEKCNGVTQAELDDSVKWLQTAADAGSAEAMAAYPLYGNVDLTAQEMLKDPQAVQEYKDRSKRYLDTLVAAGSSSAMYAVAMDYENGVMLPQNSQLAYAYMFASELTSKRNVDETAFPFTKFSSSLTPEQVESAREMGRRIHAACCQ